MFNSPFSSINMAQDAVGILRHVGSAEIESWQADNDAMRIRDGEALILLADVLRAEAIDGIQYSGPDRLYLTEVSIFRLWDLVRSISVFLEPMLPSKHDFLENHHTGEERAARIARGLSRLEPILGAWAQGAITRAFFNHPELMHDFLNIITPQAGGRRVARAKMVRDRVRLHHAKAAAGAEVA